MVVLTLLALLVGVGAVDDFSGLLMVAPFLGLLGLLMVGLYPGEQLIEKLVRVLRRRARTLAGIAKSKPSLLLAPHSIFLVSSGGSRAPPLVA